MFSVSHFVKSQTFSESLLFSLPSSEADNLCSDNIPLCSYSKILGRTFSIFGTV